MHGSEENNTGRNALDELKIINRVLDRISRLNETNHILSIIIDELVHFCRADQGVISLVTETDKPDLVTLVRSEGKTPDQVPYRVNSQIFGWVLRHRHQLLIADLDADQKFPGLTSENGQFKSIVCTPMVVRDGIIGLSCLTRRESQDPFDSDAARMAGILSSQSAPILRNAVLLEQLAEKNRLLKISQGELRNENARLKSEIGQLCSFEGIVGRSEPMREVLKMASKVSANDSPVLICGATGTGKELIARAIHFNSRRSDKPFVVKNCGVKTETLLEDELFGHVKGAYTDAVDEKPGLFREADGGTIFLDEVGEAPLSTQVAILRVLESGEIRPVGSSKTEYVDVRVISATNRDLAQSIADGTFRQDLYFRLNTLTIDLPPLKERPSDIPLLVDHFLKQLRISMDLPELSVSPAALEALIAYDWPGNVRQLEHELQRAAVVSDRPGVIDVKNLSPAIREPDLSSAAIRSYRGKLKDIVEKVESEVIAAALADNDGNISRTAEMLGLTRKGLKDKKARYGIE